MKEWNYKGNSRPFAAVLCHSRDRETVRPLLEELTKSGLRLCLLDENAPPGRAPEKACSVIAMLTGSFYGNEKLMNLLLRAGALKKEIVPLRGDSTPMPEVLNGYLYAINSVNLSKYDAPTAAQRILASDELKVPRVTPAQKKAFKTAVVAMVAAALLAAGAAVYAVVSREDKAPAEPEIDTSILEEYGISREDLESIYTVVLLGDQLITAEEHQAVWDFCTEDWENDHQVWYRMEDGSKVEEGGPEDLSFLTLLPNLRTLVLVNQTNNTLPDLSSLRYFSHAEIWDCSYDSVEALRNCTRLTFLHLTLDNLTDLSPLSGCTALQQLNMTGCRSLTSLDGLTAPRLSKLQLHADNLADISALADLPLRELELNTAAAADLSPLAQCEKLTIANISGYDGSRLRNLSALGGCPELKELYIDIGQTLDLSFVSGLETLEILDDAADSLQHIDAAGTCTNLYTLRLCARQNLNADLAFLGNLSRLQFIKLEAINGSLAFLEELAGKNNGSLQELSVSSRSMDYAGLSAVSRYGNLHFNLEGSDSAPLLEALREAQITDLKIEYCNALKVEDMPAKVSRIGLKDCPIISLEGFPCAECTELILEECGILNSLDGVEKAEKLDRLILTACPRLNDYTAVYGKTLSRLELTGLYALPDFGEMSFTKYGEILFDSIPDITDLSCLDALPDSCAEDSILKIGVLSDEPLNLNALLRFRGSSLTVSPVMEDQAADLVERECFSSYSVEYPQGGWSMDEQEIELLSLEELDTLPKALLKHVTGLTLADDTVYTGNWWCECWGENNTIRYCMRNGDTDETVEVRQQGTLRDFSRLSQLTGLRYLRLYGQKMDSLDGIQELVNLTELDILDCDIGDISAVFALDSLECLNLGLTGTVSLQGIQNLTNLVRLSLQSANVTDLSPLKEMSFSGRVTDGGFDLCLPHLWAVKEYLTDYSALAAFPWYSYLSMNSLINIRDQEVEWVSYLQGKDIGCADLFGCFRDNEELAEFVSTVNSVRELHLGYNDGLTDLTCLTKLKGLEVLCVSGENMEEAVRSLDGVDCSFEIIYEP